MWDVYLLLHTAVCMMVLLQPDADFATSLGYLTLSVVALVILIACSFDQPPVLLGHMDHYFNRLIHYIMCGILL